MSLKRSANHFDTPSPRRAKISRTGIRLDRGKTFEPKKLYTKHSESGVGDNYHSVSYPLALIPYSSWFVLHHGKGGKRNHQYTCSKCSKKRARITPHERKLFLVAERLSWHGFRGIVPAEEKALNEEQLWAVNFELGITDPAIEDPSSLVAGGKNSQANPFYPFQTEAEMEAALALLRHTNRLSELSFNMWLPTLDSMSMVINETENERPALNRISSSASNSIAGQPSIAMIEDKAQAPPTSSMLTPFKPSTPIEQSWLESVRPLVAFSHATVKKRDKYHKQSSIEEEAVKRLMAMAAKDPKIQRMMDDLGKADRKAIKAFGDLCTSVLSNIHDAWAPRSNRPRVGAKPLNSVAAASGCVPYGSSTQQLEKKDTHGVAKAIAARAASNPKLRTLLRKVASEKATKTEIAEFEKVYKDVEFEAAAEVQSNTQPSTPVTKAAVKGASSMLVTPNAPAGSNWPFPHHMEEPTPEKMMAKYSLFLQAVPPPVVHRISEIASLDESVEVLLAKAGNKTATPDEMKRFDNLVNLCYVHWTNDQKALELELSMPKSWEVHGMRDFTGGREKYRKLSAVQRGGVQSSLIHYMISRACDVRILNRLFSHISSGRSTQPENDIFLNIINCFERFFFNNNVLELQSTMTHLEIAIKDALIGDITYRYIPMLPDPVWTQTLADVAKTRAMLKRLYHLGPIAETYGENGLCWVDLANVVNPQDRIDVEKAAIPVADFKQMYPPVAAPSLNPSLTLGQQDTATYVQATNASSSSSSSSSQARFDSPRQQGSSSSIPAPFPTPPSSRNNNKSDPIEVLDDEKVSAPTGPLDFLKDKTLKPASSFRTLPEFYSLLDDIERTSYVGSRYLEMYAEYLHKECCNECWLRGMGVEIEEEVRKDVGKQQGGKASVDSGHDDDQGDENEEDL
ncbi:hypothetical protein EG328_000078 [Venturia inaequalis]|uniref:Uncharacterized protein n=1 Tax=Venturia inaequalis TaxID=5025 RepID=A0A8H3VIQ9_VENIN|nr:hypothetical protein EG328_000078 [Venturia inaequalis]